MSVIPQEERRKERKGRKKSKKDYLLEQRLAPQNPRSCPELKFLSLVSKTAGDFEFTPFPQQPTYVTDVLHAQCQGSCKMDQGMLGVWNGLYWGPRMVGVEEARVPLRLVGPQAARSLES